MGICAKSLQSFLTLCYPMDCSSPDSSVHGILQARILESIAISSSRRSSQSRDWTQVSYVSCIGRRVIDHCATWEAPNLPERVCVCVCYSVVLTLFDSMDCQAPLSVGILQARILEWFAMTSSRGSSQPRDRTQVSLIVDVFFTI